MTTVVSFGASTLSMKVRWNWLFSAFARALMYSWVETMSLASTFRPFTGALL
jgi:hypothetical protein